MKQVLVLGILLASTVVSTSSSATERPHISDIVNFTNQEKRAMVDLAEDISSHARNCLIYTYEENIEFHENVTSVDGNSVGTQYGDQLHSSSQNDIIDQIFNEIFYYDVNVQNRPLVYRNAERVQEFLEKKGMAQVPFRDARTEAKRFMKRKKKGTSCVTLARDCIRYAFAQVRNRHIDSASAKIMEEFSRSQAMGTVFINLLRDVGWKVYYWNPDTSRNDEFDLFERYYQPKFSDNTGYHRYIYSRIAREGKYLEVNYNRHLGPTQSLTKHTVYVDDARTLTNFGDDTPRFLKDEPFYMGIAHMGFHVFLGSYGEVIEGHSKRPVSDSTILERSDFNPLEDGTDYFRLLLTDNDRNFLRRNNSGTPRLPTEAEYRKACRDQGLSNRQCNLRIQRDQEVRLYQVSEPIEHVGGPRPFTAQKYMDSYGNYLKYYRYRSGVIIVPPRSH